MRTKEKGPYHRRFAWVKVLPFREQAGENSRDDDLPNVRRRRLLPFSVLQNVSYFSGAVKRSLPYFAAFHKFLHQIYRFFCPDVRAADLTKAQKADILLTAIRKNCVDEDK